MPNPMDSPEEIRRRMAEIRAQLHAEMSQVVEGASTAFDWQSYVKARPWTFLGAAFLAGYVVVPRRRAPAVTVAPVVAPAAPEPSRSSLAFRALRGGLGFAWPIVSRIAQRAALQGVESFLEQREPSPAGPSGRPAGPPPSRRLPTGDDRRRH